MIEQIKAGTWKSQFYWPGLDWGRCRYRALRVHGCTRGCRKTVLAKKADIASGAYKVFTGPHQGSNRRGKGSGWRGHGRRGPARLQLVRAGRGGSSGIEFSHVIMLARAVKRQEPLGWGSCLVWVPCSLAFAVGGLLLALRGQSALDGLWLLLHSAFGSGFALEDCLIKAAPIFLCSVGVGLTFRLQVWNIGAEGQFAWGPSARPGPPDLSGVAVVRLAAVHAGLRLPGRRAWGVIAAPYCV